MGRGGGGAGAGRGEGEGGAGGEEEGVLLDRQKNRCLLQNALEIDLHKPHYFLENSGPIFGLRGSGGKSLRQTTFSLSLPIAFFKGDFVSHLSSYQNDAGWSSFQAPLRACSQTLTSKPSPTLGPRSLLPQGLSKLRDVLCQAPGPF